MENQTPSRPVKGKRTFKPLPNEAPFEESEVAVPTSLEPAAEPPANKYARKVKVGSVKTIGRSPNYVESVGLGKLRVITTNGIQSELRSEPGS